MSTGRAELEVEKRGGIKMEMFLAIAVLVAWFALQAWILPRFGVST